MSGASPVLPKLFAYITHIEYILSWCVFNTEVVVIASATLATSKGNYMKRKRLLIVKVDPLTISGDMVELIRKSIIKQLKSGVVFIDNSLDIECIDYDSKQLEVKVIHKDDDVVFEKKDS